MSRVFLGLMLAGAASAFVCDTQLDVVSDACCVGGSSSRRLQIADLAVCTLPSTCNPKCKRVYSAFYAQCAKTMELKGAKFSNFNYRCSGSSGGAI